ncbi:SNF2 family N-terminal domain-containing protein [Xylaria bambusicola]|uniref:SNF2 family N-terminal domain-containing protein n=1 Tax=Xylaria bambusicola TaxID=326684 RepID=UPI0020072027|nr:SNF2 family N-terminal domain-containing protein [Xylaria bambusicola]KAI0526638.1 SNF2 family N-terminal domain-containing protein [Xylaria bambusicola]
MEATGAQKAGDHAAETNDNAEREGCTVVDQATTTATVDTLHSGEGSDDIMGNENGSVNNLPYGILDEASALEGLDADVRDQDDLERDITYQASLALNSAEDKRDEKRIEKAQNNTIRLEAQKKTQEERFRKAIGRPELKQKIREEISRIDSELELTRNDIAQFENRIRKRQQETQEADQVAGGNQKLAGETHREFLIRTGKITPFDIRARTQGVGGELADVLADAEEEAAADELEEEAGYEPRSHQNLRAPGFAEDVELATTAVQSEFSLRPRKRQRAAHHDASSDEYTPQATDRPDTGFSDSQESEDYDLTERPVKKVKKAPKEDAKIDISKLDDGIEANYQSRLTDWIDRRSRARLRRQHVAHQEGDSEGQPQGQDEDEWFKPSPDEPDHRLKHGLKLPGDIYPALFDYQKTGVQWLAELYSQRVGGIIGDEMGLGKTVQVISFIAALHYSKKLDKPVLVVAPATVLQQWVNEFHRWWPPLRVSMLHSSGSGMLNMSRENEIEDEDRNWDKRDGPRVVNKAAKRIIDRVVRQGHVLVTTYASVQIYGDMLATMDWGYAVLDEGHKIRNPNAAVTIACKELCTPNRIILSGTPIQNNLVELWSLFDFIYPMRLGTLVDFRKQIEIPIKIGGYANASHLQIMTAEKTAQVLKENISPYLLQRLKVDVATDLPKKREQVLFCKLTKLQHETYRLFLDSKEMGDVLKGNTQSFFGIDRLRKICNHPDLVDPNIKVRHPQEYGAPNKSGKMQVLKALLGMWRKLGHKTLLFSQTVQMLDILEQFVQKLGNTQYLRMDGKTPIKMRQVLVDKFNKDPDIHLFLLTTKVGGLGVNLTGANRVIIYDPDWNPSTDVQARERAWRLGQKKDVTIYRLMTAGTIEEKIYHRQIFKQFLSNKVLKDPKHRTTFNLNDLHDLFTLGPSEDTGTETSRLFKDSQVNIHTEVPPATMDASRKVQADSEKNEPLGGDEHNGLQRLDGVAGLEDYETGEEAKSATKEEDRIMEGLFARSGVHSAHEHDAIIDGKQKPRADRGILQQEAARVASEAAAVLRRAKEQARHVPIGTVTWTGEFGEGGRPSNIRRGRGGPGSASVLSNLSDRQGISRPGSQSPRPTMRLNDFMKAIPQFIKRQGGRVPTKSIVDHFNPHCKTREQTTEFKEALNRVAKMDSRGSSMRGIWVLREG